MNGLGLEELGAIAAKRLAALPEGAPLNALERALIKLAVAVSVTSLNRDAIRAAIDDAQRAGATPDQMQEIVSMVSALGVHSLMAASVAIADAADRHGSPLASGLNPQQQQLWDSHVGDDPYWAKFRNSVPGFLEALIRLSPDQFRAFFDYCALPWRSGTVRARTKELAALACDATSAHRFLPGFLLHLDNAIAIGNQRLAILETLDIAADAPAHVGYR
jgi:alkylhydroperoxidase/carboxymuconolactone decarboxylase family protein YurZ